MRMNIRQIARTSLLAALLSPVAPHLASADVIDGEWCKGTSHFTIDGPNILTPGGNVCLRRGSSCGEAWGLFCC